MDIQHTFTSYLEAIFSNKQKEAYDLLYDEDVKNLHTKVLEIATRMDKLGEAEIFLKKFNLKTISNLKALSIKEFTISILELSKMEIGKKMLEKLLKETKIIEIEEATFISIVHYEYPLKLYDEWQTIQSKLEMIQTNGQWKILFKSGMEVGFNRFHDEIDRYEERKLKDNLSNFRFEGDLTKFTLIGYKDFSSGKIVFEPRFRDAGDFSDGLAPVQIIKNYGYINLKGEIAIKPQFLYASEFSENVASVQVETAERIAKWGFINKKGTFIIEPIFENTRSFKSGLCAVKNDDKWGYVNKKGELIIPYKFDEADDFSYGTAVVELHNDEGESTRFIIDKKGKIKELY